MNNGDNILENCSLLVIKIGSALVANIKNGGVRSDWIDAFTADIAALKASGKKIILISSGGVALGRTHVGISVDTPPLSIPLEQKQAASAVGQFHLFAAYHKAFEAQGLSAAQVLITMGETENRRMYLNSREALYTLLANDIIPIINENDVVSTGEIRFGDNDRLAVRVAQMVEADTVLLLSTTDGLYTSNPDKDPQAQHIDIVEDITQNHIDMAGDAIPGFSTGGMKSKIEAAISATRAGINLIIANGIQKNALKSIFENKNTRKTTFVAKESTSNAKKRWIEAHLNPKGSVFIDNGALKALQGGKSLLPIGISSIEGLFERGDIVEIKDENGTKIGIGLSAYSAENAAKIIGQPSDQFQNILGYAGRSEIIHRNDMALID